MKNLSTFLAVILLWPLNVMPAPVSDEATGVLARILDRIPGYVDFSPSNDHGAFCIVEDATLYHSLSELGKQSHSAKFIDKTANGDLRGCRFAYVPGAKQARKLLINPHSEPPLLISNYEAFIDEGGAIALVDEEGHFNIHLNLSAAKNQHITFNPDLIEISRRVVQ